MHGRTFGILTEKWGGAKIIQLTGGGTSLKSEKGIERLSTTAINGRFKITEKRDHAEKNCPGGINRRQNLKNDSKREKGLKGGEKKGSRSSIRCGMHGIKDRWESSAAKNDR